MEGNRVSERWGTRRSMGGFRGRYGAQWEAEGPWGGHRETGVDVGLGSWVWDVHLQVQV